MELVVHGTKQGYKSSFIPNLQPTFALGDIRNGVNNENPLGKSAYSLVFINSGCVFTKYTIVRDTLRSYATGNIAFSLFLPANKELSGKGADVKSLLDKLSRYYFDNYVRDNNINRGETALIQENWSFVNNISSEFTEQEKSRKYEEITSGIADPAFHYYKSDNELIEHFDEPFQEDYGDYRQILFIDSNLQGDSNPLNVLKNSGIEVNPDLKDGYYYLNNYNSSKGIKITANGKLRSDKKGENQIRAKWRVEIKYSKDERCYEPIYASGTISDLSSEIHKYIEIKGNHIMLKYDTFNNPNPLIINVAFEIKDRNGKNIEGAEIFSETNYQQELKTTSNIITFKGEDIIKKWFVWAIKGTEDLYSDKALVTPERQLGSVVLTMQKQKILRVFAIDSENDNKILNFRFWCNDGKGYRENITEISFINEEIDKTWNIEVSKKEGRVNYIGKTEYCPAIGENPLFVQCQKTIQEPSNKITYKIDAGEHGKKSNICPGYSNSSSGNDLDKNCIIANKGYTFTNKWVLKNDTLVAQCEKEKTVFHKTIQFFKSPSGIAISVVSVLVLTLGIWALYSLFGKDKQLKESQITAQRITDYVKGDSLMLDKLNTFKADWEKQKPEIEPFGGKVWYNPTTWFVGSNQANLDSTDFKEWNKSAQRIDAAIIKRNLLTGKKFAELKKPEYFTFPAQQSFKTAIEKIDINEYADVEEELGDVSALTLTQVEGRINEILKTKEPVKEEAQQGPKQIKNDVGTPKEIGAQPVKGQNTTSDKTAVIKIALQSAKITKQQLIEYSKANFPEFEKSIKLYQEFWDLVNAKNQQKKDYVALLTKVNANNVLNSSELKNFLNSICASFEDFNQFNSIPGKATCESLTELKSKIKINESF